MVTWMNIGTQHIIVKLNQGKTTYNWSSELTRRRKEREENGKWKKH